MRLEGCQRGRHQNFPSSLDCYEPGVQRLFGEVFGLWGDSQDTVFWNLHGEKHFLGNTFKSTGFGQQFRLAT